MIQILFATDGSGDAAAAGRMLEAWPLAGRAGVTALTVVPPIPFFSPALIGPASAGWAEVPLLVEQETGSATRIAEEAAARLGERGAAAEPEIRHGTAADQILEAITEHNPDLVVLGSHGQSRLTRLLIGSVSQNVAKHAACPTLVVRDTGAWRGRILLAVDGSAESETATRTLTWLPLPEGTTCTVLHVLQPLMEAGDARVPQRLAAADHLVEKAAAVLTRAGHAATPQVRDGHPAQEILRSARDLGADLIVVGARGLSGIREFLLGSVSGRVLRYAPCSVLIARENHREP